MKLLPHQIDGADFLISNPYSILGDGMGLGKTAQAIEVKKITKLPTLVICPSFLVGTWKAELEKFGGGEADIISYSSISKHESKFKNAGLIIADEAQYLKNLDAQRTIHFHEFIQRHRPERLLLLTGTAIKNRVGEFYSLLALTAYYRKADDKFFQMFPNYYAFVNYFSNAKRMEIRGRTITKYEGHKNIDKLKELMQGRYLRRKASEVLDLPPMIRKDVIINEDSLDYEMLNAYEQKHFINKKEESAKTKTKYTVEYVIDLISEGQGPILIYSDHVAPVALVADGLKKFRGRAITGATPMAVRDQYVKEFQEGKLDYLVATIGSLSVGVTLIASTNVVFNDLPWVPSDLAQAEKRIHRIGQDLPCIAHRILYGKVDRYIARQLDEKIQTLGAVL